MTATQDLTQISPVVRYLDPALDGEAAEILAAATGANASEAAAAKIAEARAEDGAQVLGLLVEGRLAGAYILRKEGMVNEMSLLAIAEPYRKQGYGRMCAMDALLRSGGRPMIVETDDAGFGFYKAVGFKIVAKRKNQDGVIRYRLGWHAPMPSPDGNGTLKC